MVCFAKLAPCISDVRFTIAGQCQVFYGIGRYFKSRAIIIDRSTVYRTPCNRHHRNIYFHRQIRLSRYIYPRNRFVCNSRQRRFTNINRFNLHGSLRPFSIKNRLFFRFRTHRSFQRIKRFKLNPCFSEKSFKIRIGLILKVVKLFLLLFLKIIEFLLKIHFLSFHYSSREEPSKYEKKKTPYLVHLSIILSIPSHKKHNADWQASNKPISIHSDK